MKKRWALWVSITLWTLILGSAAHAQRAREADPNPALLAATAQTCPAGQTAMMRLELVFGMSRKDGTSADDTDWKTFLDSQITPRFPDGLTVLTGYGQWRGPGDALVREGSRVLLIWHIPGEKTDANIDAIRSAWKAQQNQDSVMRANSTACVSF